MKEGKSTKKSFDLVICVVHTSDKELNYSKEKVQNQWQKLVASLINQ